MYFRNRYYSEDPIQFKLSEEGYTFIVKDIANSFKILKIKQNNNE